ncbi:hypothetical protein BU15DRAFT_81533 [Melanogaster broomeanus]|nr:hypothetical protein BU15DRAFT_81533 [Melanogaster broomeanus]
MSLSNNTSAKSDQPKGNDALIPGVLSKLILNFISFEDANSSKSLGLLVAPLMSFKSIHQKDVRVAQLSPKFTLTRHTKAINAVAISGQGSMLLSGGNDSHVVVWNLSSGEMIQEICIPSAGFISCLAWIKLTD